MLERSTTLWLALTLGLAGFALALVGCSGNQLSNVGPLADMATANDLTAGPDLSFPNREPTDHPDPPMVSNFGGPVIDAPEIWTVVWKGDEDLGAKVNTFTGWMLGSDYWKNSMGEYGVHPGIAKGLIVLPDSAPATLDDSAFKNLVKSIIAGLGEPVNANSIFSFVIPEATQSSLQGGQGCVEYGGYHSSTRTVAGGTTFIPYMVNLQCMEGSKTLFDLLTEVISHEAAEAASDPYIAANNPAWNNFDVALGGEIGNLFVELTTSFEATVGNADAGTTQEKYVVQRLYSQNAAASGTTDPCVPAPASPYFNVALVPTDTNIKVDANTGSGEAVIKIQPFAYGDVGPITWTLYGTGMVPGLVVAPKTGIANAGETIRVTVQASTMAKGQQLPLIVIAQTADGAENEWFGSLTIR